MPTIEVRISDLESLLEKRTLDQESLERLLERVKGEVKEFSREADAAKLELNDSNRPDLWSPEGIARQISLVDGKKRAYPFFDRGTAAERSVNVSREVAAVRPFLAACVAKGVGITDPVLLQLIQSQEKLAEIFGRKRQTVSIGLYRLPKIAFPVRYELADPGRTAFTPLGFDQPMTLAEIVRKHPKGIAYAGTLGRSSRYPILVDSKEQILSFPPIINSREIGEVQVGDSELFVEVTGTDLRMVMLALNIFACNLFDRGAAIEPVSVHYPEKNEFGKVLRMPLDFSAPVALTLDDIHRALGEALPLEEAAAALEVYGYRVGKKGEKLKATAPPYRDDTMHPIDVIEDVAISRGYGSFQPEMPSAFTVGSLSSLERFSDRLREAMIGFGFQEIISNILGSRADFIDRMRIGGLETERPEGRFVEIENPMTERFSILRPWLLPSLLRAEGASSKAFYPHRIFEVGEVAQRTPDGRRTETRVHLAALVAHPGANFSELHAVLEALFYELALAYRLESIVHPTFIEGRVGAVQVDDRKIGLLGEVDPEVLSRWQIGMPSAGFEFDMEALLPE